MRRMLNARLEGLMVLKEENALKAEPKKAWRWGSTWMYIIQARVYFRLLPAKSRKVLSFHATQGRHSSNYLRIVIIQLLGQASFYSYIASETRSRRGEQWVPGFLISTCPWLSYSIPSQQMSRNPQDILIGHLLLTDADNSKMASHS
ncbi:hypothetical protein ACRALDRAFT_2021213 [Sodiomyces alcalophilus JCM 7366]|uniref:uncharacterized protein n=1 Tax=Sodiomyces alcalophilus JCM 7366 TaxID=591952 RepID=UPI0039B5E0DA